MHGEVRVVEDVPSAFAGFAEHLRPAVFALSGGSTARRCYERLADADTGTDWSDTAFLLSDERWVDVAHPDSNEGQSRRVWLDKTRTGPVHSLREAGETPEAAADAYERVLAGIEAIDLLHLGLGDDGHTASLFPGSPALAVTDRFVVATGDDAHDWPRMTFTYPAIARSRTVVVTVSGEGKREAFARVRDGDPAMPASRIEAPRVVWLADPAAAGG